MIDILILLLDEQYEEEIFKALSEKDFIYHKATTTNEVVEICRTEFIDLILCWPATQDVISNLLTVLNINQLSHVPVIPVLPQKEDIMSMMQQPVADVISIPLPKAEFYAILHQVLESFKGDTKASTAQNWDGSLAEFSLIELIQMIEASQKDAILTISYKDQLGQLYFHNGKVIRASLRNLNSMDALNKLLILKNAYFHIEFTRVDLSDSIELTNQELLSELSQNLEEQQKYLNVIPDNDEDIITLKYPQKQVLNSVQTDLLKKCEDGANLFDLLVELNQNNISILQSLEKLFQDGYLVLRQDYDLITRQSEEKKGVGGMFKRLFKKEKKPEVPVKLPVRAERKSEELTSSLRHEPPAVDEENIQKIQLYLKEL